jgi:hypothetical protein
MDQQTCALSEARSSVACFGRVREIRNKTAVCWNDTRMQAVSVVALARGGAGAERMQRKVR